MTITLEKTLLTIGKDFVDCAIGQMRSHGEVEIDGKRYRWQAVVPCGDAEHFIRAAAKGHAVTFFSSQTM